MAIRGRAFMVVQRGGEVRGSKPKKMGGDGAVAPHVIVVGPAGPKMISFAVSTPRNSPNSRLHGYVQSYLTQQCIHKLEGITGQSKYLTQRGT